MKTRFRIILFAVMSAAILAAPASQILKHERVLREGRAFKFRAQPVDPYDAFRGRYVRLSFAELTAAAQPPGLGLAYRSRGEDVQVAIGEDSNGFAIVRSVSKEPPAGTRDYVTMETGWRWGQETNGIVNLIPPFSQFFMNETLAPLSEDAYRRLNRRTTTNVWAVVRVLDGRGVIENLMFEGVPAADYVRAQKSGK